MKLVIASAQEYKIIFTLLKVKASMIIQCLNLLGHLRQLPVMLSSHKDTEIINNLDQIYKRTSRHISIYIYFRYIFR